MTIAHKLREIVEESKRNQMRVDEYLGRRDCVITDTGVIQENSEVKGQLQLITNGEERRVQMYSASGTYLCECPFSGDDERGYEIGMALYRGYTAAWQNADLSFSRAIHEAISRKHALEI